MCDVLGSVHCTAERRTRTDNETLSPTGHRSCKLSLSMQVHTFGIHVLNAVFAITVVKGKKIKQEDLKHRTAMVEKACMPAEREFVYTF